jgi:type IV pilus assembly protein PilW
MVGLVIGLVLLIAVAYFFIGGRQVNRTTEDVSRIQESGRNALELMGHAIRQAGSRNDANSAFSGTALSGTDGASNAPDTITVQYESQPGGEADCAGTTVASGLMTYAFAINRAVNPPVLTCNGTVVVDGIEDLQVSYGIDANRDGNVEFYTAAPTAAQFPQVSAVRVNILVRGLQPNVAVGGTQTYSFNGANVTATDGFLRRVFTATYTVRNQAW